MEYGYEICITECKEFIADPQNKYIYIYIIIGTHGSIVVKALGYKLEGRGFETRWGEILNLYNPSGRTRPWGSLSL
jgi:hypothetical protein